MRLRSKLHSELNKMGDFIQRKAGLVLFSGIIVLAVLSFAGLKYSKMESKMEKLWVEGKRSATNSEKASNFRPTADNCLRGGQF